MKFFVNASSFSKKKSHTAAPFFSLFYIFFRKRRNSRTNNFPIISLVGRATQRNIPSISMGRWRASINSIMFNKTLVAGNAYTVLIFNELSLFSQ